MDEVLGYKAKDTAAIVGVTYRQLDHWATKGILEPSLAKAQGRGSQRLYSFQDLVKLKLIRKMLDNGLSLQKVTEVLSYVKDSLGQDIHTSTIFYDSKQVILVTDKNDLLDLINNGQGVLGIIDINPSVEELETTVKKFTPISLDVPLQMILGGSTKRSDPLAI